MTRSPATGSVSTGEVEDRTADQKERQAERQGEGGRSAGRQIGPAVPGVSNSPAGPNDSGAGGERWRPTPARIGWIVIAVVVFAAYNTWVLYHPLNGHDQIMNGYLSELSASDQPNDLFFRGGDLLTAVIALGLAARWLLTSPDGRHRLPGLHRHWRLVGGLALLLFGLSTFFDAFFAMDCSPTLSLTCGQLERTGQLSTVHYLHTYTSVGAQIGITTSLIAATIALAKARARRPSTLWLTGGLALTEVAALVVMMSMLVDGDPGIGWPQAVMVVVAAAWCALVAIGHANPRLWTLHRLDDTDDTFELDDPPGRELRR